MTGYHQVPRQTSFFQYSTELDPWAIKSHDSVQPINFQGWDKTPISPPSLFDEQQDWSPPDTPPSSPPSKDSIKRSFIKSQQYISTSSPVDPWTVVDQKDDDDELMEEDISQQNLYKTELCRSYMETHTCRYGVKCQFAHGRHELRPVVRHPKYKTEICKTFHTLGTCPYGIRCRFIHTRPSDADNNSNSNTPLSSSVGYTPTAISPPSSPPTTRISPPALRWSNSWSSLPTVSPVERSLPPSPEDFAVPEVADPQPTARRLPIFQHLSN